MKLSNVLLNLGLRRIWLMINLFWIDEPVGTWFASMKVDNEKFGMTLWKGNRV
jgi:hypothetical protein